MQSVELRPMLEADLVSVLAVQAACYPEAYHEPASAFAVKLAATPEACWVACSSEHVVAYLAGTGVASGIIPVLHSASPSQAGKVDCWHLHDLAVSPSARSLQLGGRLLAVFAEAAGRSGIARLSLVAVQGADAYWSARGFVTALPDSSMTEVLSGYGEGAIYMVRELSGEST